MKKRSLYWKCQIIGWSVASLYWGYQGFTGTNFSFTLAVIHFVLDVIMYILLTHLYRNVSLRYQWHLLPANKLLLRIIPAVVLLGAGFMFITIGKIYLVRYWFQPVFEVSWQDYFQELWVANFMTGIRLMSIWILAYYGYHFAQRETQAIIAAKDAQLNNLAAQLNPHFFFNSLNNIKALVLENPQSARRAIDLLSDLLRTSLYGRELITIAEEMALVKDYLELEGMRFEKRLQSDISVDVQLLQVMILPLSIQTLVENAIKHGIAERKEGGIIHIHVTQEGSCIKATVEHPGKLKEGKGLGLKNLTERLQLQFNGAATFRLKEENETILATLIMPLL